MITRARNGYTEAEVKAALHAPRRELTFRYELLDSQNRSRGDLATVLSGSVAYNKDAQIKRTGRFTIRDDGTINFLSDRIKPYVRVIMPGPVTPPRTGYAEFPQGVLLLSTPPRGVDEAGVITRQVEAYDQAQILLDDKVIDRYTVQAGDNYIVKVGELLTSAGITWQNLTPASTLNLPAARDWPPGTPKLKIIQDLLLSINYRPLWFNEEGYAVAQPYVSPDQRPSEYTYADDQDSVLYARAEQSLDLFSIPNKWVLYVSESDRAVLQSVYTNSNASSLTSTVNRGRTITDVRRVDAVNQTALDGLAQRIAFAASQVYEEVNFETAIMPFHSDSDVLTLAYSKLTTGVYHEISWSMELRRGAPMKHAARRVVAV